MNIVKRLTALCLTVLLLFLTACGTKRDDPVRDDAPVKEEQTPAAPGSDGPSRPVEKETTTDTGVTMKVAAMTGPTGMGLVYLMDQFGVAETLQDEALVETVSANGNRYVFDLAGTADEISPLLIKGELDAACVPANLASALYNKTKGEIVTLGINTLGVIYVVDKGDSIQSLADLKGKSIVSAGKGAVPEYGLRYLLAQNGIDPDRDLTIEWKSEQSECVAALASGAAEIAVMPQPYVTVAQTKIPELRVAVSLTEEWKKLDNGSAMLTGVVVARKSFIEEHPEAIEAFLQDYAASVAWVNSNTADAAQLIGKYGIVAADVAEKALPHCNIVCITGAEMKEMLSGYLAALAEQAPQAVGGAVPAEDFYYDAQGGAASSPFEGKYHVPADGSTLSIRKNADGTYAVELSIYRLTTQDDGVGTYSEGVLSFTATDAAGNPMTWEAVEKDGVLAVTVVKSAWSLLPVGEQFEFHPMESAAND